jgi:hypothetical protein
MSTNATLKPISSGFPPTLQTFLDQRVEEFHNFHSTLMPHNIAASRYEALEVGQSQRLPARTVGPRIDGPN